jgi:hypothetical protein
MNLLFNTSGKISTIFKARKKEKEETRKPER